MLTPSLVFTYWMLGTLMSVAIIRHSLGRGFELTTRLAASATSTVERCRRDGAGREADWREPTAAPSHRWFHYRAVPVNLPKPCISRYNARAITAGSSRRHSMAVDGKWNITMNTPMGSRNTTVEFKTNGN